jgi:hypothetical protein
VENRKMENEEQDIANAFAEFAAVEDKSAPVVPVDDAAKADADAAAAAPVDDAAKAKADADAAAAAAAAAAPVDDAAKTKADADAAAVAAVAAAAAPVDDAAKAKVDALVAEAAENPEFAALREEIAALRAAQPKVEPAPAAPVYSAEDKVALDKYMEDWPDVAKGEALLRRAEYRELVGYIFQQVEQRYTPALDYMQNRSGHDQYSDIVSLVPDYDDVRDKAIAWVETQPDWLKATLQKVTSEGSPVEIAGLIAMYKKETGYEASPPVPVPAPAAPVAKVITLPPAAKNAAVKLAAVKSGRSEQGSGAEDDFESAFAGYAAQEEQRLARK